MSNPASQGGSSEFSSLLDELASIAGTRKSLEREYRLLKLSESAKEKYNLEPQAYLDLYQKYHSTVSRVVRLRSIGNYVYKVLVGGAALGATLSALNLYGFLSDQREKAISESWKTIDANTGKPYDAGRQSALQSLLSYGQILYNANLDRAPLIRLRAHSECQVFGIPLGPLRAFVMKESSSPDTWPEWCFRAELQEAEFRGAKLYKSDFTNANLYKADFSPFPVPGKPAINTQAQYINFSYANLQGARLNGADLSNADLKNADLSGANLSGAILRGANLKDAILCETIIDSKTLVGELLTSLPSSCGKEALKILP